MRLSFSFLPFVTLLVPSIHGRNTLFGKSTETTTSSPLSPSSFSTFSCSQLVVELATPISYTAPYYASWNIDSSRNRAFFDTDWSNAQLRYLATSIGGARIRFGGTGNDYLNYALDGYACPRPGNSTECLNVTMATDLFGFAQSTANDLIFGLNIHPTESGKSPPQGPWNASNAEGLLRWSLENGTPPWGLELGNEQNNAMTAKDQALAFQVLYAAITTIFGKTNNPYPVLVGPDTHGFHAANDTSFNQPIIHYLMNFITNMSALNVPLFAVTHHEYIEIDEYNIVDPDYLDNTVNIGQQVVQGIRSVSSTIPIWAGEIGPHNGDGTTSSNSNCDNNRVCGRYGSTLWYADALGSKATVGYQGFMRQDLIGAYYALINTSLPGQYFPTPDYYFVQLWRQTVSNRTTVLTTALPNGAPRTVRTYAFCGKGEVILLLLNLANTSSYCVGPPAGIESNGSMQVYTLTPATADGVTSVSTLLNGQLLALNNQGILPPLNPIVSTVGDITLPPLSITLAVMPIQSNNEDNGNTVATECMV